MDKAKKPLGGNIVIARVPITLPDRGDPPNVPRQTHLCMAGFRLWEFVCGHLLRGLGRQFFHGCRLERSKTEKKRKKNPVPGSAGRRKPVSLHLPKFAVYCDLEGAHTVSKGEEWRRMGNLVGKRIKYRRAWRRSLTFKFVLVSKRYPQRSP